MPEPLSPPDRRDLAARLPAWAIDGETLRRTFEFADFNEALGFVTRVGLAAEAAGHHPDMEISWNRVTLALSTHSAGALTDLDRRLALRIDGFTA